jgi:hypothetical protein
MTAFWRLADRYDLGDAVPKDSRIWEAKIRDLTRLIKSGSLR